jgi:hypothetical protein
MRGRRNVEAWERSRAEIIFESRDIPRRRVAMVAQARDLTNIPGTFYVFGNIPNTVIFYPFPVFELAR